MSLPRFSVNNPVLVDMLMVVIIVVGGVLAMTMNRELFPESRPRKLAITTVQPGVSPQDIEKTITSKIEEAVRDVEGVERIDSTVSEGMSATTLTLRSNVKDLNRVMQDVKSEIDAIEDLPEDSEKSLIKALEPQLPVIAIALYGPGDDAARKRAGRQLREELLQLPGVSEVHLNGTRNDEISIEVRPEKLLQYDITLDEIAAAIRDTNLDLSAGTLEGQRSVISVRTLGEEQRGIELGDIVIRGLADGRKLNLSELATIRDEFVETNVEAYFNGEPALSCVVYQVSDQDAVDIATLVKAYIAGKQQAPFDPWGLQAAKQSAWYWRPVLTVWLEFSRSLQWFVGKPDPVEIYNRSRSKPFEHDFKVAPHTDLARFVEQRIALMVDNGLQGLLLVLLSLILFLNRRVAFWAAMGLPVTFLGTFLLMWMFGQTINLVSLMGLIMVLGFDVDEAIVMSENVCRHLENGLSPKEAAIKGAEEVMWPIVVMTGTTIGAFLPLLFVRGEIGTFMGVLPMVVTAALLVSMVDALVILPAHLSHGKATPPAAARAAQAIHDARQIPKWHPRRWSLWVGQLYFRFGDWFLNTLYDGFIRLCLRYRYATAGVAFASFLVTLGIYEGCLNINWVQKIDSETLISSLEMPMGTPVSETRERLFELVKAAQNQPEVVNVQTFVAANFQVGTRGSTGASLGTHLGQLIIELKEAGQRTRNSDEVIAELRKAASRLSGVNSVTFESLNGGPGGKAIEIQLSGRSPQESLEVAGLLKARLATFNAVFDIDDNQTLGQREIQLRLKPSARPAGVTVASLGSAVRSAVYGREARRIHRDREDVKLMVRYPKADRSDLFHLETMWIPTPRGSQRRGWIPFLEVAEISETEGENTIHRSQQNRAVTVMADVDEKLGNENDITAALTNWFETDLATQYPDVKIEFVGSSEEIKKFNQSMLVAYPAALLIIYALLVALFRSYVQPLIVLVAVPFGVEGAILGHWLTGYDFTFMSAIGLVALNGVVVNDSLVLVDFMNTLVREGVPLQEAMVQASKLRLRAIVLTTVTTTAGMAPLLFETSFQAKFLVPLAITIPFGLALATVATLVMVPALNLMLVDAREGWRWVWGTRPNKNAEPPIH